MYIDEQMKEVEAKVRQEESRARSLAEDLKVKMQEQMECLEALEAVEKDKKALENRLVAMAEGEGAAMQELSAQLASAEEERGRACGEVEEMKALLRGMDVEKGRVGEERERLAVEVRRLVSVEEESTRMRGEVEHMKATRAENEETDTEKALGVEEKERLVGEIGSLKIEIAELLEEAGRAKELGVEEEERLFGEVESLKIEIARLLVEAGRERALAAEEKEQLAEEVERLTTVVADAASAGRNSRKSARH